MVRKGMRIRLLWENQKERDHCKDLDVGGKIYKIYLVWTWLRIDTSCGLL
jgi:hypothetical protein